jgi:hypothetical protein
VIFILLSRGGCAFLDSLGGNQHDEDQHSRDFCIALSGCATKYQEMGFTGGVAAQQVTADTWRIQARGNSYTNNATVQDYVLLKAAETSQAAGGTHFQIVSAADASRSATIVTPGTSTTSFVGNQAVTTTTPGSVDTIIKPGQDVYSSVETPARANAAGGLFQR